MTSSDFGAFKDIGLRLSSQLTPPLAPQSTRQVSDSIHRAGLGLAPSDLLAMRAGLWPRMLSLIGVAVAGMYWLLVVANVFGFWLLISLVAGLGAVILAPIWYFWIGLLLGKLAFLVRTNTLQEM